MTIALQPGVCIKGHVLSEIGLGQAARNLGLAVEAAGLEAVYLDRPLPGRDNAREFAGKLCAVSTQRTTVHVLSAVRLDTYPLRREEGKKNILYPFWELEGIPKDWLRNIQAFDEIWAPSQFVADTFRRETTLPVIHMPQPVALQDRVEGPSVLSRKFAILSYLDMNSYVQRKNPSGALNAFLRAFPDPDSDTVFCIKLSGDRDDGIRRSLAEVTRVNPRIRVIDKTISRSAMDQLLRQCDVLLSLHRSEGFGLGAAEALALGKAVVATDYSGTRDFVTHETGFPVAYEMTNISHGEYVDGTTGQQWADPSVDDAAKQLRLAYADESLRRNRGKAGRLLIERQHSPAAVGKLIAERLNQLWA